MKKLRLFLLLALPSYLFAQGLQPLPVDQAFKVSVKTTHTDSILVNFAIAKGYYLYRDHLHFKLISDQKTAPKTAKLGHITQPPGKTITDKFFGKQQIFTKHVSIAVPLLNLTTKPAQLEVTYQGCAKAGFCYPPTRKLITYNATTQMLKIQNPPMQFTSPNPQTLGQPDQSAYILSHANLFIALLSFFGFGILLAFTPCVLPMLPILSGIIINHGAKLSARKAFSLSLTYVFAMAFTYATFGIIVGSVGTNLQAVMQAPWIIISFSCIFVLLALSLFGFYDIKLSQALSQKLQTLNQQRQSGTYLSVFGMGLLSTLIVSPCVTPPLVGALAYIGNSGNATLGGSALFALGLGMGLPLLIVGTSYGKLLPQAGAWMDDIKNFFGVVMLAVAIWILGRVVPAPFTLFLYGILAIMTALFMDSRPVSLFSNGLAGACHGGWLFGSLVSRRKPPSHATPQSHQSKNLTICAKIRKGTAIILLIYGSCLIVGASMGNSNPWLPLHFNTHTDPKLTLNFHRVTSLKEAKQQLALAKQQHKPALLDFYADWCVTCHEMEQDTFTDPAVIQALQGWYLIKADVTKNNRATQHLNQHFKIIAPPVLLFFAPNGEAMNQRRVVGKVSIQQLLRLLRT